jgi:hypothetical protein
MSEKVGPFAGIACERPYPVTGLTSERWIAEVPLFNMLFDELILTQDGVYFEKLFYIGPMQDPYPHVVFYQGKFFLEDGHSRVCRAALQGADYMLMRVYTVEDL